MKRISTFLLITLSITVLAQNRGLQVTQIVPPGPPYEPDKHVNPIITYVQTKDFKPSTYKEAQQAADIQLLGLSKELGSLESVALAPAGVDTAKQLKLDVKATFYPVVRQAFKTASGGEVVLFSFKAPRIQGGSSMQPRMSNPFPFGGRGEPKNKRFGPATLPEVLEIRGRAGLIFESDKSITVAWMEEGTVYVATSGVTRKDLFRVIDDLL